MQILREIFRYFSVFHAVLSPVVADFILSSGNQVVTDVGTVKMPVVAAPVGVLEERQNDMLVSKPSFSEKQHPSGNLISIDNTLGAVLSEAGHKHIKVKIHSPENPLSMEQIGRFGNAKTWGEVVKYRLEKNGLPQTSSDLLPKLPPPKEKHYTSLFIRLRVVIK